MSRPRKAVRTGAGRWWVGVYDKDCAYYFSHNNGREDTEHSKCFDFPGTEFDELVVSSWCHIEMMDTNQFWMSIANITINLTTNRDGKPILVRCYGPGDWDEEVEGCRYGHQWNRPDDVEC